MGVISRESFDSTFQNHLKKTQSQEVTDKMGMFKGYALSMYL